MTLNEIDSTVPSDDEGKLTLTQSIASRPTDDQIITCTQSQDDITRRESPYSRHKASTGHQINGRNVTKSEFDFWLSGGRIIGGSDNSITNVTSTEGKLLKIQPDDKSGPSKSARRRQRRKAKWALPSSAAGPSETTDSPEKDNSEVLINCQSTKEGQMSRSARRRRSKRGADERQNSQASSKNTISNQSQIMSEKDVDVDYGQTRTTQINEGTNLADNLAFGEAHQENYGNKNTLVVSNEARGNSKQLNGGMINGNEFFGN